MSTELKLRRGTQAEHSTFTGAVGEMTIDTTNDTPVVHDGVKVGGHSVELKANARLLGVVDSSLTYDTSGTTLVRYLYSSSQQKSYSVPVLAHGKVLSSLVGNVLTTTDSSTYSLPEALKISRGEFSCIKQLKEHWLSGMATEVSTAYNVVIGDGGGGSYTIKSSVGTGDILDELGAGFTLDNGFYAFNRTLWGTNGAQFGLLDPDLDDATPNIQAALTHKGKTGGVVTLPFKSVGHNVTTIIVPYNVHLKGEDTGWITHSGLDWSKTNETFKNTWIRSTGAVNIPTIKLRGSGAVSNLRMYDGRQKMTCPTNTEVFNDTAIAIQLGDVDNNNNYNQSIENVTFIGYKKFIRQWVDGASHQPVERLRIYNCHGMPFECAIDIAHSSDSVWVDECHFNPNALRGIRDDSTRQNMAYSLSRVVDCIRLGQADGLRIHQCHALAVRTFIQFYKDAYTGDPNTGGGVAITATGVDMCHRGVEFLRNGPNDIGGSWVGGQIIPVVYIDGSENCAFYYDTVAPTSGFLQFAVTSVSIHTGGTNAGDLTPQDNDIMGTASTKAPRYIAEIENGNALRLTFTDSQVRCEQLDLVDRTKAYTGTNSVVFKDCRDRTGDMRNISSTDPDDGLKETSYTENTYNRTVTRSSDNRTHYQVGVASSGGVTVGAYAEYQIRAGGVGNATDAVKLVATDTAKVFRPVTDDHVSLGVGGGRWSELYATNGTIQTSDIRLKSFSDITDVEKLIALEIKTNLRKFKWNSSIDEKGISNARIHFGAGAQDIVAIFESYGLDATDYALLCYDEWEDVLDDEGNIIREAGNMYGVRYTELLAFIISAM